MLDIIISIIPILILLSVAYYFLLYDPRIKEEGFDGKFYMIFNTNDSDLNTNSSPGL